MMSDEDYTWDGQVYQLDVSAFNKTAEPHWTLTIDGRSYEVTGVDTTGGFFKLVRDESNPTVVTWVKEERE